MSDKKGVEMSIQTLVVAALSLLILIVLIMVFTGQINIFTSSVNACEERGEGYSCKTQCGSDEQLVKSSCPDEGDVCCATSAALGFE